jgi:predicted aminopeptidase
VVDFTVPDPLSGVQFAEQVRAYLAGDTAGRQQHAVSREALEKTFRAWLAAAQTLDAQAAKEPRIGAIAERRKEWVALANSGLEAIESVESGKRAPDAWAASRKALIKEAGQSRELVDFVILAPMDELFQAASGSR